MSPQPLSKLATINSYSFGTDAIHSRPELMALAMRTIAGWAITESHLGNIFATLLNSKKFVTVEMYSSFDSFSVRKQMLVTAAKTVLPQKCFQIFEIALSHLNAAANYRHSFAHGIWGVSQDPNLQEALLLAQPRAFWKMRAQRIRHAKKVVKDPTNPSYLLKFPHLDPSKILVYRKRDLVEIFEEIEASFLYANALLRLVESKPRQRQPIIAMLSAQPPIRAVLDEDRLHLEAQQKEKRERARARGLQEENEWLKKELKKMYKRLDAARSGA